MAKAVYVGVGSKAHNMKKAYIGVGGKARKVKKMYIGVGGKARLCYSAELEKVGMATALSLSLIHISLKDILTETKFYYTPGYSGSGSSYTGSHTVTTLSRKVFLPSCYAVSYTHLDHGVGGREPAQGGSVAGKTGPDECHCH